MRLCSAVILFLLICATVSFGEESLSISVFSGPSGQKNTSIAKLFYMIDGSDPFSTGSVDHTLLSWAAFDLKVAKTATLGLNGGSATAYIWSGINVVANSQFNVSVNSIGTQNWLVRLYRNDGSEVFSKILRNNVRYDFDLLAVPAGLNSWRTKGYKAVITTVPELDGLTIIVCAITSLYVIGRKKIFASQH